MALVSHQLIQVDVLFGDALANLKQLVLAVNFWSGFTMPLFAGRIQILGCVVSFQFDLLLQKTTEVV